MDFANCAPTAWACAICSRSAMLRKSIAAPSRRYRHGWGARCPQLKVSLELGVSDDDYCEAVYPQSHAVLPQREPRWARIDKMVPDVISHKVCSPHRHWSGTHRLSRVGSIWNIAARAS